MQKLTASLVLFVLSTSVVAQDAVQWRVEDGGNGHWYVNYDTAEARDFTWDQARVAATELGGHLVCTETEPEHAWVASNFPTAGSAHWLGLYQDMASDDFAEPDGGWYWVTGDPLTFERWNGPEPNNSNTHLGGEHVAQAFSNPTVWNDAVGGEGSDCRMLVEYSADCNNDDIVDYGQILDGTLVDLDGNGVPDVCEVLNVPDEYATIQDALDASVAGNVILVQPGTYTGEGLVVFTLPLHLVTIVGAEDQEDVIIDGESVRRGMDFNSGGDTLNPTIRNLVFRNCDGRAITLNNSNLTLEDCDFVDNTAVGAAAILTTYSDVTLTNCFFRNNVATDYGAILLNGWSSGNFTDCVFVENHSTGTTTGGRGGVMHTSTSPTTFDRCIFVGNTGMDEGTGALEFRYQVTTNHIANSIFCSNSPQDIAGTWIDDGGNQFLESNQCADFNADCDGNGVVDFIDVYQGTAIDCNNNSIPDECELTEQFAFSADRTPDSFGDFIEFDLSAGSDTAEDVALQLSVVGELASDSEFIYVYLDETLLGFAFATDGLDCEEVTQDFLITSTEWNSAGLDGTRLIRITGINIDPAACANPRTAIDVVLSIVSDDCDENGTWDKCDPDSDEDGTIDACDNCPDDPYKTELGECGCGIADTDSDGDSTPDCNDPCPYWAGNCSGDGQTLYVAPGESIQAAIDGVPSGGIVEIAAGTYQLLATLDPGGKALTLRGATVGFNGTPTTILDGQNTIGVLICQSAEGADTIFEDLLIINGNVAGNSHPDNHGGGIFCRYGSSPTITRCIIQTCSADGGGGIACMWDSSPAINDCAISYNTGPNGGGGIYCYGSSHPTIVNCLLEGNTTTFQGGGLYVSHESSVVMDGCTVTGNQAEFGAGAYPRSSTIINCAFTDNRAVYGGALACAQDLDGVVIENCTFTNNISTNTRLSYDYGGGAIHAEDLSGVLSVVDCAFTGNQSLWGGAVRLWNVDANFQRCTFTNNGLSTTGDGPASADGGALHVRQNSSLILTDCNATGNESTGRGGFLLAYSNTTVTVDTCTIDNNFAAGGGGGFGADAASHLEFVDTVIRDNSANDVGGGILLVAGQSSTANLATTILCGNTSDQISGSFNDLGGNCITEVCDSDSDETMDCVDGCPDDPYKIDPGVCGCGVADVDTDRDGTEDCNDPCPSWPGSCSEDGQTIYVVAGESIQTAINLCPGGGTVSIGPGTYTGTGENVIALPGNDITIIGSGGAEATVVDGQSARRCLQANSLGLTSTVIDGITFQNGWADLGAGIRVINSDITFSNCVIRNNSTPPGPHPNRFGGGVLLEGNNCNSTFSSCVITGNFAVHGGGVAAGLFNDPHTQKAQPTFSDCQITHNSVYWTGGGIWLNGNVGLYLDCDISNNHCNYNDGGGMFLGYSAPQIVNCTIMENSITAGGRAGAGILSHYGSPTITACTIMGNALSITGNRGSGIDFTFSSGSVTNSVIRGNSNGPGVALDTSTSVGLGNNALCGNTSGQVVGRYTDNDGNCILDDCGNDLDENGFPDVCDPDCDGDNEPDAYEISSGQDTDCNENFIPDGCDITDGTAEDCNENDLPDACDIADGTVDDDNDNGIPDSCDINEGDLNLDGCVDGVDLAIILGLWGVPNPPIGDFDGDGTVGGADLARILGSWRPCPG